LGQSQRARSHVGSGVQLGGGGGGCGGGFVPDDPLEPLGSVPASVSLVVPPSVVVTEHATPAMRQRATKTEESLRIPTSCALPLEVMRIFSRALSFAPRAPRRRQREARGAPAVAGRLPLQRQEERRRLRRQGEEPALARAELLPRGHERHPLL